MFVIFYYVLVYCSLGAGLAATSERMNLNLPVGPPELCAWAVELSLIAGLRLFSVNFTSDLYRTLPPIVW